MTARRELVDVIADAREEAAILRRNGAAFSVDRVEAMLAAVADAAEEWTLFLSEGDAVVRCGYSAAWLRARFPEWERAGHARTAGRARQYRACIIPRRANVVLAASRGRDAARRIA
jgi:hypothetical protein